MANTLKEMFIGICLMAVGAFGVGGLALALAPDNCYELRLKEQKADEERNHLGNVYAQNVNIGRIAEPEVRKLYVDWQQATSRWSKIATSREYIACIQNQQLYK